VEIFAERIHYIMLNLPENPEEKRMAEVELAYIIHDLYSNHDIVIAYNQQQMELRSTELQLTRE
jgi:small-conductance mechanosensitive channel